MDSQVEQVKSALDIVTVVQQYVPSLKPSGRNFFGRCPFHQEKTPSFSVNPELQIYKCFGCGEGGDVLSFIQKIEGLEFPQTLELAAQKAGIELKKYDNPGSKKLREEKERAFEAHRLATEYYHYILLKHKSGKPGLDYLVKKRKLDRKEIVKFRLGYAPKNYHNLENFLLKKKYTKQELIKFGLLVSKNGKIYDKFRQRIIHPISDMQGRVVGFSGRIIISDTQAPKYLNSPESIIYHKKGSLYGAYEGKDAMRTKKFVVMVEGNIDVVSSWKAGVENIVCPLGTALTSEQITLLKRYVQEIYFCFDKDQAGKKALLRSLELAEIAGVEARAVDLEKSKDADEYINTVGPKYWATKVSEAMAIPEFIIEIFKTDFDLSDANQKLQYLDKVLPFIAKIRDKVKIDHYLQRLELVTATKYEVLAQKLNSMGTGKPLATVVGEEKPGLLEPGDAKIERKLAQVLSYLYLWKDRVEDLDKIRSIYKGNLAKKDLDILDLALSPDMEKEKSKYPNFNEMKKQIVDIIADSSWSMELQEEGAQKEIEAMMRAFVLQRLKSYLNRLRIQSRLVEKKDQDKLLQRVSVYAEKLKELQN